MSHGLVNLDNTGVADKLGACCGLTAAQEARKTPVPANSTRLTNLGRRIANPGLPRLRVVLSRESRCWAQASLVARSWFLG